MKRSRSWNFRGVRTSL